MNKGWIIGLLVILFGACQTSNRMLAVKDKNLIDIKHDEEEYELLVLDPGFETWFQVTWSPAKDRSLAYYKSWNQRYVIDWNEKARRPHTFDLFNNIIQYDANINYGLPVERKLFYYFRWVETELNIPILTSTPPGGIL